jgi:hypothetical protein
MNCEWHDKIFGVNSVGFESLALEMFRFQFEGNEVYNRFAQALGKTPETVHSLDAIPFLPIEFFKSHRLQTGIWESELVFESSGTTGLATSKHYLREAALYKKSFRKGFEYFYGPVQKYCVLGLLPSYLERQHSSLVYMADDMIRNSGHPLSGFYLDEHEKLASVLMELESKGQPTILIGVTFGLLDFIENHQLELKHTFVMETGGMKGRREELLRINLHRSLGAGFGIEQVHSEYGMTELLSQAYSLGDGVFQTPPWMKILLREEDDPLSIQFQKPCRGVVNVIDLANLHSCSFIATDDAGRILEDDRFEILGRIDQSDIRGCSLLTA